MKREIKFRAKVMWEVTDFFSGGWVYGHYYRSEGCSYIINDFGERLQIDIETLGQYTGLRDAKRTEEFPEGEEIYEGCNVKVRNHTPEIYKVSFIEGGFCLTRDDLEGFPLDINMMYPSYGCQITVI